MPKILITFTEPQEERLRRESDRLGLSVTELVRRAVDAYFPDGPVVATLCEGNGNRIPLRWTTDHPASSYGLGVLLLPDGQVLTGAIFRLLRDLHGRIETTQPGRVCGALGLPPGESGIG